MAPFRTPAHLRRLSFVAGCGPKTQKALSVQFSNQEALDKVVTPEGLLIHKFVGPKISVRLYSVLMAYRATEAAPAIAGADDYLDYYQGELRLMVWDLRYAPNFPSQPSSGFSLSTREPKFEP